MSGSVSFDRAASYYDATRATSPEAEGLQTDLLVGELEGRGLALEIGVGTGRIALPLHRRGVPLAGVDLSTEMLAVLAGKAGGSMPFPVAVADAARLPFADGAFGAALASHVLHLVGDLDGTLDELVRVVGGGGLILLDVGAGGSGYRTEWWRDARDVFADAAGIERRRDPGELRARVSEGLRARGATLRPLAPIEETIRTTPEERIAQLEDGLYSFTWSATEDQRRRGADALRERARDRFGSLAEPVEVTRRIQWLAYDLPS